MLPYTYKTKDSKLAANSQMEIIQGSSPIH